MASVYLERYFAKHANPALKHSFSSNDDFVKKEIDNFLKDVYALCQVIAYMYAVWARVQPKRPAKPGPL